MSRDRVRGYGVSKKLQWDWTSRKHAGGNIKFKNFPYPIINLSNGGVIDWYDSIESMSRDCDLLAKNKDITLTY